MGNKRDRFVEFSEAVANKTFKDLYLIGELSNRSAYEFEKSDIRKIFVALQQAMDAIKLRFFRGDRRKWRRLQALGAMSRQGA